LDLITFVYLDRRIYNTSDNESDLGGVIILEIVIGLDNASATGSNPMLGNGLAIVGAWAASLYILLGREAQRAGLSVGHYVLVAYSVAAIALLPLPFLAGASYVGYPLITYGYIALMALLPQLIGHTSFNWAIRHMPPTLVTLVILLEPIGSTVLASLLFREIPGIQVLFGAIVLLVGVAVAVVGNSSRNTAKSS
jgi:drug/metabolite transporter (DMT)-like permease